MHVVTGVKMENGDSFQLVVSDFLYSGKKLSRDEIREKCRVRNLPNAEAVESHPESYSGYINVNEREDSVYCNLFFWLFPAEEKRDEAPFILWLNGGPGSSSLKGLFAEHGAYQVNSKNQLEKRHVYLSQKASVLYLDNPVDTGFSHTNGGAKRRAKTMTDINRDLLSFLDQFFDLFPEFLYRDFYICGESFGGKYVPSLALEIHKRNQLLKCDPDTRQKIIKLVGLSIGAPFMDPVSQIKYGDMLYGVSLINDQQRRKMLEEEEKIREGILEKRWADTMKLTVNLILGLPTCLFSQFTGYTQNFNILQPTLLPQVTQYVPYLNKESVRKAIHAGRSTTFNDFHPDIIFDLTNVFFQTELPSFISLLEKNYRVLIYSSQLDIITPAPPLKKLMETVKWKKQGRNGDKNDELSLNGVTREIWRFENKFTKEDVKCQSQKQIAGYIQAKENLTFVELLNAGHMAFVDAPDLCMHMMFQFLYKRELKDKS